MECSVLSEKIREYIRTRASAKLEIHAKDAEKKRKAVRDPQESAELENSMEEKRQEIESHFKPAIWLTDAAHRAKQIQLVTHALKYTHSDAKGSSCYTVKGLSGIDTKRNGYICSGDLANQEIDVVGNAAALDVAKLLLLEHEGKTLIQYFELGDATPLQPFAEDEGQLDEWLAGFQLALTGNQVSSHHLAKQIYFPVGDKRYHLLSPLFASSLAQAIHNRVTGSRYSDEAKTARTAKRESRYSGIQVVEFPRIAQKKFGGTKPQNVSYLNSVRGGKTFLLPCGPPVWEGQMRPPLNVKSVFTRYQFGARVGKSLWALQQYLEKQAEKSSVKHVRDQREERIDSIIDQLIQYGAEIQTLEGHDGWSATEECLLPRAEQLWLDPARAVVDEVFALERAKNDWQEVVADRFAHWLNNRLKSKKLLFGDVEHREWQSLVEQKLRLLKDDPEVLR